MNWPIYSPKYGQKVCLVDPEDYTRMLKFGNGSGKWSLRYNTQRNHFYVEKRTETGLVALHRFIMNAPKGKYVDHINGNTLDNRRRNLRICTNGANLRNAKLNKRNTSGAKGLSWSERTKSWEVSIKVNYKRVWLGRHKDFAKAVAIRKSAEQTYWDD